MNKTTKVLSISVAMFAIVGMMGFSNPMAYAGNGANDQGKQIYHLNLIGVKKGDKDFTNDDSNNGHRIFVPENGKTKIYLKEGPFEVIDFDGVNDDALFQLPKPNLACTSFDGGENYTSTCDDSIPSYFVYYRALGQPDGSRMLVQTCYDETALNIDLNSDGDALDQVCSDESIEMGTSDNGPRKGGAKFQNVTKELLTICYDDLIKDGNLDGQCDIRTDIFDASNEGYYWDLDNNGRKLVQLKFIEVTQNPV
ncbi:MAG: hypothetical protein PVG23_07460 [Nitrosopumilaceae archaeon]